MMLGTANNSLGVHPCQITAIPPKVHNLGNSPRFKNCGLLYKNSYIFRQWVDSHQHTRCQRQPVGKISCWQRVANANPSVKTHFLKRCNLRYKKNIAPTFYFFLPKCRFSAQIHFLFWLKILLTVYFSYFIYLICLKIVFAFF